MRKSYLGEETEKAVRNFPCVGRRVPWEFVEAMVVIKRAAAEANFQAGKLSREIKNAIVRACQNILRGGSWKDQFVLPAIQGGAGTSIHMNVNEVIARRAIELSRGKKVFVHYLDHVNCGMSTNDVNPSALRMAAYDKIHQLINETGILSQAFSRLSRKYKKIPKLARTHLQDAVPTTFGAECAGYAASIYRHVNSLKQAQGRLRELNLGGTAIGNCINASPIYRREVYRQLRQMTGVSFRPARNLMSLTSSQGDFVAVAQGVSALLADVSKIANDLRLLSSGPHGGFNEVVLPALQKGSTIMPGKVNPVIPELVTQVYFVSIGNTLSIIEAAQASQLELGVMLPVIIDRLLESLSLATMAIQVFHKKCIQGITVNVARCKELLEQSCAYATLLTPVLGYDRVSRAVNKATVGHKTLRQVVVGDGLMTDKVFTRCTQNV